MHWAQKCPHKKKIHSVNLTEGVVEVESVENEFEEINVVLMTEKVDKMKYLLQKHQKQQLLKQHALKLSLVKNGFKIT